jgi:hypothetical protein
MRPAARRDPPESSVQNAAGHLLLLYHPPFRVVGQLYDGGVPYQAPHDPFAFLTFETNRAIGVLKNKSCAFNAHDIASEHVPRRALRGVMYEVV